jgi:hypothetical protein
MRYVIVTMSVAALVVGSLAGSAEAKARRTGVTHTAHSGTFVSAANGKLVMTGNNGKEQSHPLAKGAKFTIDGKPGTLDGFKKGMQISVTLDKSENVTAASTVAIKPATPATKPATSVKPASTTPPRTPATSTVK